jgi:UDP-GlcNAc:undecaprenyl-phosphate/decaprenyl-phosphate GlcNAc-1-phosphate transferase
VIYQFIVCCWFGSMFLSGMSSMFLSGMNHEWLVNMSLLSAPWARVWVLPAICAFAVATVLTGSLVRIAPRHGWVVVPRKDRWSVRVVAQFGGIPIVLAFALTGLLFFRTHENVWIVLLTCGMAVVGWVDDVAGLAPKPKLLGQVLMAAFAVQSGVVHPLTQSHWINFAFTIFWIVGITNALNLLENMDGLAAGVSIIASAQIILLAGPMHTISGLALCMLAASAGFLVFNMNPAKVFMGDVGALSIGFFLACASVKTAEHLSSLGSVLFVPSLALFIPVFDTLLVSVTRRLSGRPISRGGRDHSSHRLVLIGLNERQAVGLLYTIAATAGVMAYLWKSSWGDLGAGLVGLFLILSTLFWIYLAKVELPDSWRSPTESEVVSVPRYVQQVVINFAVIVLDAAVICLALYFAYLMKFERLDRVLFGRYLFAAALSVAIKVPLLLAFGLYRQQWAISRRQDIYPVLKAVLLAACLLTAASAALPRSKTIESSIILFDAVFSCMLLVACRGSSRAFDDLLGKKRLLDLTLKRIAHWASMRQSPDSAGRLPDENISPEKEGEPKPEQRPN